MHISDIIKVVLGNIEEKTANASATSSDALSQTNKGGCDEDME